MEKEIGIHCKTKEEFKAVQVKGFGEVRWEDAFCSYMENSYIDLKDPGYGDVYNTGRCYTIITAAEYLGGKDVKEFEGLEVPELINGFREGVVDRVLRGTIVSDCCDIGSTVKCPTSCNKCLFTRSNSGALKRYLEGDGATKPKTTKENNMKENNIDSNVLAIFGDKVKGNELVVIDRHFTDNMLKEILMEKHHKAIQEACDVAEAKRLEKESKE